MRKKVESTFYDKGNPTEGLVYDDFGFFVGRWCEQSRCFSAASPMRPMNERSWEDFAAAGF
jgi:hypothetical protein